MTPTAPTSTAATTPASLLADLRGRGFSLSTTPAGGLAVQPGSSLTGADRDELAVHGRAVAGIFREEGEQVARLLLAADSFFAASGVSSTNPAVVSAVAAVWSAMLSRDLATVRFAVMEFRYAVREAMRAKLVKAREARKPC